MNEFNLTRYVAFDAKQEGVLPYPYTDFVSKYGLKEVEGFTFFDDETYMVYIVQPASRIVDGQDLYVNSAGSVFSVGSDNEALPDKLTKEV